MSTFPKAAKFSGRAIFSPCRTWRYYLDRTFLENGESIDGLPHLRVVMLNPSTADENVDDPTIRRVQDFARRWGHRGVHVLNLFAVRSTDPAELWTAADPVGPSNDVVLRRELGTAAEQKQPVLAAWGSHGALRGRAFAVMHLVEGVQWICLGKTKRGLPLHPLYVPANRVPVPFGHDG